MKTTIYNGLTRSNIEVDIIVKEEILSFGTYKSAWYEIDGERLFRIETRGKSGKSLYKKINYLNQDTLKQNPVFGSDGATGHGWGGSVIGFMTLKQIETSNLKIK